VTTTRDNFCDDLRNRLQGASNKTLLRVVVSPNFDHPSEYTGEQILQRAQSLASSLLNLLPPDRSRTAILLLLPHCPELFLLQLGLVLNGHVPAILPWPTTRIDAEKYQCNLIHQLNRLPADLLVTLPQLAQNLGGSLPYAVCGLPIENGADFAKMFPAGALVEQLHFDDCSVAPDELPDDALFLQFSGGTTGAQKAVVVTSQMLGHQFEQLSRALGITASDVVVSWLPMYHDMGLIACFWLPMWCGGESVQIAANDWVLNPELLFRYVEQFRGTLCWLPNFSFSYLSQRREFMRKQYNLDSVRAWINCSEPVRQRSITQFANTFADFGVQPQTIQASYAMAETVFAITQSDLGSELSTIARTQVLRGTNRNGNLSFDLLDDLYVSSGVPLSSTQLRIRRTDGALCCERECGEIYVRTPSLFSGYWSANGFQSHTLQNGWHATGDYGFIANGELFVIGRFKDIIIVGGNNIFPEDVEAVVNTIPGVSPGRIVAFGIEDQDYGTQSLALVAEVKANLDEHLINTVESSIRKIVLTAVGTAPRHVAVVPQRWIVKSTAGKISRTETRDKFVRERLKGGPQ
jgi:fatty-acyl-CoA synthase